MEPLIRVKNMYKIYNPGENEVRALDDVSLEINQGEFIAIVGHSGSGKSTFMNILVDAIDRSSGEILYNGKETISMGKDYRNLIGYMPQQQGVYSAVLTHLIPGNIFWTEKMLPISQTMNCLISAITRSASSFRDLI